MVELSEIETPAGRVRLAVEDGRLCALGFADHWTRTARSLERRFGPVAAQTPRCQAAIADALERYFDGDVTAIDEIDADPGGTPFQRAVWSAVRQIPAGTTASYRELGSAIGLPAAVRAVGTANGANPIGIVIPCHRVLRSDGQLGGYGGGLARKRWLLDHERSWA